MKTRIFMSGIAIVAFTGFVFIKNYSEEKTNADQDLLMQNVEALSSGESGDRIKCYTSFRYENGASVVDCTTCTRYENHTDALFNFHDYCITSK